MSDAQKSTRRALVIEDDPGWSGLLAELLGEMGFYSDVTPTLRGAAELLAQGRYELAIVDLMLGRDLDLSGLAVLDMLSDLGDATSILVCSAISETEDVAEIASRDNVLFLHKRSLTPSLLTESIESLASATVVAAIDNRTASVGELHEMWAAVSGATTNETKGKSLEHFAARLFATIPGFELVERNVRTASSEIDLVFAPRPMAGFPLPDWGSLVLVECRNRSLPSSAGQVRDFGVKMDNADSAVGLFVSPPGITGREIRDAQAAVAFNYARSRRRIIVISEVEVELALNGFESLVDIIDRADRRVRLSL